MKAKLLINGQELEVEISEEELKKFEKKQQKKTGYERVEHNQVFWYDAGAETGSDYDFHGDSEIQHMYDSANYYSNFDVAYHNIRADKLMRQLRRFAVEHRKRDLDWNDSDQDKYFIFYNFCTNSLSIQTWYRYYCFGVIHFDTIETAQLAMETFHDELMWYFTEYKDSL